MMEQMERKCGSNFSESHRSRRTSYNRMTVTAKNVTFVQTAGQSVEEDNASQDFDVRSVGELQSIFATSRDSEVDNTSWTRLARLPSSYSATPELPRDQDALMDRVSSFYPTTVPWWSVTEGDLSAALPTHYE